VLKFLVDEGHLSQQTLAKLEVLLAQFGSFAERGHGILAIRAVTPDVVRAFVYAPTSDGLEPGLSLQHFRRTAVRQLFRTGRRLGIVEGDPPWMWSCNPAPPGLFRPLEDDEVELARATVAGSGRRARLAASWAVCEATARTGELPALVRPDLDLDAGRVWLHGSPRTTPRWGELTVWGLATLEQWVGTLPEGSGVPLLGVGEAGTALAQSSAVGLICQTLTHAGLGAEPDVRPASVAAWAGRKVFDTTGRVEVAAQRLGIRSLDGAARFIGWDWSADGS
jgi:integrase/recombinase XerC